MSGGEALERQSPLIEELEACERLKRELKRRAMIWQSSAKEELAIAHGLPSDGYFNLSFDEWNALWLASQPPPLVTVDEVFFRAEVLQASYFRDLACATEEEEFVEAICRLYASDNSRGRRPGEIDLYALFAEIDWPEGYYYCMDGTETIKLLHRDLLRRPERGVRYKDGRWKSRGYTPKRLDEQANIAQNILSDADLNL